MCGIAAFSGIKNLTPEQARIATNKMKILGLFNQSRGTHGCGLYINQQIFKGIEDTVNKKNTKEFDDFISNLDFVWPEMDLTLGNTMFLHTRQATSGVHTEANTHPFFIRSHTEDARNNLIGVHNGTIENIWSLCNKYEVPWLDKHIQVDSKALYTLIDKVGLPILREYKGYAALVYTKPSDPHSIYVYHGASRKEHKDPDTYEERPMYYLKATEGLYFSSMPSSLLAIRESVKQEVKCLEYNVVIKVTNGKFTTTRVEIDRDDANLPELPKRVVATTPSASSCHVIPGFANRAGTDRLQTLLESESNTSRMRRLREDRSKKDLLNAPDVSLVLHETMPKKALAVRNEEIVYFHKGRYYRSGNRLCHHLMYVKDRGIITQDTDKDSDPYWFWQGVLMRDQQAYEALVEESKAKNSWVGNLTSNFACWVSRFSMFPVTNMDSEAIDKDDFFRFSWYFNERRINTKFTPKWSGRCYVIVDGFLVEITSSNPDDKKTTDLPTVVNSTEGELFGEAELNAFIPTQGTTGACGQSLLPVVTKQEQVSSRKTRVNEGSPFDIIFQYDGNVDESLKELFETFNPVDIEAMTAFVSEKLTTEWHTIPSKQETQAELWNAIRQGIQQGISVRQTLGDTFLMLDALVEIITESIKKKKQEEDAMGIMLQAQSQNFSDNLFQSQEDEDSWAKRFYERNGYLPEGNRHHSYTTKDTPFPDNIEVDEETPVDGSFHIGNGISERQEQALREMDEVFNKHSKKRQAEEENQKLSEKRIDEAIGCLCEICTVADELQSIDHDYANDASDVLYKGVARIKHELAEVADAHHDPEAIRRLNQEISAA